MNDYDSIEKLKSLSPNSCQDIHNDDGYLGYLSCTEKVYNDSDRLLQSKLKKFSDKIDKLEDIDISTSFKKYQDQWLKYRISKCNFIASSANKGSDAHNHLYQLCSLIENYNRIAFFDQPLPVS
ncbi:lysozyme inhibitor LprI family protein [Rosenbergiella nectarea]